MKKQNSMGNSLWSLRHASGLELKQVAKMLGLKSGYTLSKYERGLTQPRLKYVIKLSLVYKADLKELFPELTEECRKEIAAGIKQRSFIFAWPQRQKILENIHHCSYEEMFADSDFTDDDKQLVRNHLRILSNKLARV